MSSQTLSLTPELYDYLQKISLRETKELAGLREYTNTIHGGHMQSSPESAQFLRFLVELIGAKKVLEIGTFTGYATLAMALGLPEGGKIITCDISTACVQAGETFWVKSGVRHKIESIIAPAMETVDQLLLTEAGAFDFIFIDADKRQYPLYFEKSLALLRVGGVIVIDNVLWSGKVLGDQFTDPQTIAIKSLNQSLLHDRRVNISMLPVGDGLTLVRKS